MTDRTVSVRLQAMVTDYLTKMSAASKATSDLANKVDVAKGKAAEGYHMIGIAGVAVGAAVAGGFAVAVKSMATFESKMALVRTLSHAGASDMQQLKNAALTVGQAYGFSADQVADAEGELVKAGVSVKDILGGALTGALTLAAAGQTDVAEATQIAATAMTQFALKGRDVPHIADLLAAGADKALGSVGDLGYALDQAGPQAHQFGISIEETVGTLASFAQAGQIGERGGTIFSQMLIQLANPSKQASDIMHTLGLNVYDTAGQFVGMAGLAGQLHDKLSGLTQAERTHDLAVIFGQRAIRGANILYQDGAKGIEEWTKRVNDQGFAALQAAGKMDSLSGDATKLKTALQSAFIGIGEGANGPLRTLVQDATDVVDAWNNLPGPVKAGAEALVALGGAVSFAGGAAILFIPKWTAMNAVLKDTRVGAISARGALGTLGKTTLIVAGLVAVKEGVQALNDVLGPTKPDVDALTNSVIDFAKRGVIGGALAESFGKSLGDLASEAERIANPSTNQRIQDFLNKWANPFRTQSGSLKEATQDFHSLDDAMSNLVTSGNAEIARAMFEKVNAVLIKAGLSTKQITALFPDYGKALSDSAASAEAAGNGVDKFGNKVQGAANATKSATDAAKKYADSLHALADPLFAMNQALSDLRDKQHALNQAIEKHGKDSRQARQAQLDLASSSLDVAAASRTLTASVKDGSTSLGQARDMLHSWVKAGILTHDQAKAVAASFGGLIDKAQHVSHALREAAGSTRDAGRAIGVDFGQGIVQGLDSKDGEVRFHAHLLASQLEKYARLATESHSPSRAAMRVGEDWDTGLALGIMAGSRRVAAAALSVANVIRHAVAPTVTDPRQLAGILSRQTASAVNARQAAQIGHANYQELREHAHALDVDAKAARNYADAADKAADKAKRQADAMKDDTKAQKAAKEAAESNARALHALAHTADQAANAAEHAAAKADHAAAKSKDAWGKLASAAHDAAQKAAASAQQLVASVQSEVDAILGQVSDFEQTVSSGVLGDFSFTSIWQALAGTDADGNPIDPTLAQFQAGLDGFLASAQRFAGDIQALADAGLDQDAITQILGMGPTAGDQLAQQILAGGSQAISAIDATLGKIDDTATSTSQILAGTFYGAGLNSVGQFVAGLEKRFPDLAKALTPMINLINSVLGPLGQPLIPTPSAPTTVLGGPAFLGTPGGLRLPGFASGVTNFGGGFATVGETGPETVFLPRGSSVYPNGTAPVAQLAPEDRALLRSVVAELGARPVQLLIDRNGKRVIGEVANDHRRERRLHGDPAY